MKTPEPVRAILRLATSAAMLAALGGPAFAVPAVAAPPPTTGGAPKTGGAPSVTDLSHDTPIEVAPGASSAVPLQVAGPEAPGISSAALALAQTYSDAHGGRALLVWQGGKLRYERYAPGLDADTRFETFSMHKSVLGLVYGAAIRDKVIGSLDDPAGRYLQEWRSDPRGAITLRELLSMDSGLHAYSLGRHDPQAMQIAVGDQVSAVALGSPLEYAPGTRFEYNNASAQIAGVVLNRALKAAGKGDYAAYVSKVLLQPIGAGDAHLWLEHEGGDPRFFAHFQVRARDWLRIGLLIDRGGRFGGAQVLPADWIKAMATPSADNPNYGLLVWLGSPWRPQRAYGPNTPFKAAHGAPYPVDDIVFFDGFGGERVYVSPSLDLVIVRIGESDVAFDDSVIPNAVIAGLSKP